MLALADDAALARLVIVAAQRRARLPFLESFPIARSRHARAASNCLWTPDIFGAPTKHRRHYSMPQPRRRRHGPRPNRCRALELLASCPQIGEALMLARALSLVGS